MNPEGMDPDGGPEGRAPDFGVAGVSARVIREPELPDENSASREK